MKGFCILAVTVSVLILAIFSYTYIKKFKRKDDSLKTERMGCVLLFISIIMIAISTPFFISEIDSTYIYRQNLHYLLFKFSQRPWTLVFWLSIFAYVCGFFAMSGRLQKVIDWVNQGK